MPIPSRLPTELATDSPWIQNHDAAGYDLADLGKLNFDDATTLVIATGAVTVDQAYHLIDTEAAAATDDLDTINGGNAGDLLYLKAADSTHTVVLKHGTGNIVTPDGFDYSLDDDNKIVALLFDGASWHLVGSAGSQTPWLSDVDAAGFSLNNALSVNVSTSIPSGKTVVVASGQFIQILLPVEYYPNGIQIDGLLQVDGGLLIMGV